jgi:methylmalonyl-CoA mutase
VRRFHVICRISTAEESNAFYDNLAAGQKVYPSLSICLRTVVMIPDHERVVGDVGKAGVAIDSVERYEYC